MVQLNPLALSKLNTPGAQAFPLFIAEQSGDGRTIILRGRSLPYRGVVWGQEQRVEIKYFPGNPVGQAQVLGPKWTTTTMTGKWKDAFLFDDQNATTLLNFPAIAGPGRPGSTVFGGKSFVSGGGIPGGVGEGRRARVVRDAFYMLQRAGQLLRVEWGSMVRYGFITRFDANHDREEDIGFEIDFEWIGDTASIPRPLPKPKISAPGLLALILAAIQAFLNAVNAALALIYGAVTLITQRITKIGSLIAGFIDLLNNLISLVFVPAEMFGVMKQQLTGIILAVKDLVDTIKRIPQAYSAAKEGADFSEVNIAAAAAAAIAFNARKLGVEASEQREQLTELESPDLLGVLTAPEDTTLKDIATEYYGAPDDWTTIADFNGFASMVVERGTIVYVPKQQQGVGG